MRCIQRFLSDMVVKKAICTHCIRRFLSDIESPGNPTVYSDVGTFHLMASHITRDCIEALAKKTQPSNLFVGSGRRMSEEAP